MAYKDKGEAGRRDVGIIIKNPAYPGILVKPVYGKQVREYTLFRPTGPLNKDGTDFLPWRNSGAPGDIGVGGYNDWFFKEDVFDGGTANRVTFLAATLGPDGRVISNDTRPSIAHDFVRLVRRGVKDTVDELKLMRGSNSRSAPVRSPKTHGFVQGMLMARGAEDYRAAPKFPCILMLPQSARTALYDALEAPNPAFVGDPQDLASRFLSGDVLRAAGGKILVLSSNKAEAVQSQPTSVSFTPGVAAPARPKQGGGEEEFNKYICEIRPQGFPDLPRDQSGRIAIASNLLFTPWDQALRYLTEQEMIEQLVRAYSDVPHILRMGLGHIPGALPPSIASGTTYFPGAGGPAPAAPVAQVAPPPPAAPVASAAAPSFGAPAFAPVPAGTPEQDGDPALSPAPGAFVQAPVAQPPAQPAAPGVSFGASAVPAPAAPQPQVPPAPGQAPLPPDVAAALEILKRNMGAIPGMPQQ